MQRLRTRLMYATARASSYSMRGTRASIRGRADYQPDPTLLGVDGSEDLYHLLYGGALGGAREELAG
jgi:hypothetical protein